MEKTTSYHTSRFVCPSSAVGLRALRRNALKGLWLGLEVALAVHVSLTQIRAFRPEQKAAKPLTTKFVKRQPRLTKPLEMKKRPSPKRRQIQRRMVAVHARRRREEAGANVRIPLAAQSLSRPQVRVARSTALEPMEFEPRAVAEMVQGQKEAKNAVSMSLEMLDIEALDTGQYHAMVVQDPTDKRNIRGFFRLKYAYSASLRKRSYHGYEDRMLCALASLVDAISRYTDIKADFQGRICYTSPELLKTPWVFSIINLPLQLDAAESANMGRYLTSGGFLFVDAYDFAKFNYAPMGQKRPPVGLNATRNMVQIALCHQGLELGKDWAFETLPNDHGLFHCYFDFDGAPADQCDEEFVLSGRIQGICLNGRLLMIVSQKAFLHKWGDPDYPELRNERMIQFGINTIIFALTQEGSITRRVMDTVR